MIALAKSPIEPQPVPRRPLTPSAPPRLLTAQRIGVVIALELLRLVERFVRALNAMKGNRRRGDE